MREITQCSLTERLRRFADFAAFPHDLGEEFEANACVRMVAANTILAIQGETCEFFPLVLSGRARVYMMDEDGREITLYRLDPGQGCILAASCALSGAPLPGFSSVEVAGEGLFIPARALRDWVDRYPFWRYYFFSLVARQLGQVIGMTNAIGFRKLDARIASFLLQEADDLNGAVRATHSAIALEIGSRREVVSRILKSFEREGLVTLNRGKVHVQDGQALAKRTGGIGDISY